MGSKECDAKKTEPLSVKKIDPVNANDTRGPTRQVILPNGFQITACKRIAGSFAGPHIHSGQDASKNPERLFLVSGEATLECTLEGHPQVLLIDEGDLITIPAGIPHKLTFIEDSIILEIRSTWFNKDESDTLPIEL